jgi:Na+-transporting methylmalonyl-CoA/oxaloacetate decarboxylase beta subunit
MPSSCWASIAFALDTAAWVCSFGEAAEQVFSGGKVNPLIGAAGISAFPMAARVVQRVAQRRRTSRTSC